MCHHIRADLPARDAEPEEDEVDEEPEAVEEEPVSVPPAPP